ncbi:hypothetical protein CVS40_8806, partial [Lucilia cuprina]
PTKATKKINTKSNKRNNEDNKNSKQKTIKQLAVGGIEKEKSIDFKTQEIIALSSDDEYEDTKNEDKTVSILSTAKNDSKTVLNENKKEKSKINNNNNSSSNNINSSSTTLIINDSEESDSLQSQSSSQHSENYEAEDENETEMKAKQQQQLLSSSSAHTQQQLQQVQRFLKSFDSNNMEMEKNANTLNELRNFRQAPKPGKFNISTKFLRKPRNKMSFINYNIKHNRLQQILRISIKIATTITSTAAAVLATALVVVVVVIIIIFL